MRTDAGQLDHAAAVVTDLLEQLSGTASTIGG